MLSLEAGIKPTTGWSRGKRDYTPAELAESQSTAMQSTP